MGLVETLKTLNQVKEKGIMQDYAIIGGYAVIYHAVPYSTYDLDIGVILRNEDDFHGLYEYFRNKGNKIENVYIYINDMPVQFLPNYISPLYNEAIQQAHEILVEGVPSKVARVEHLIVMALEVFRAKDKYRIIQLLGKADNKRLNSIIRRFDNEEGKFRARYREILADTQESKT